jgi:hypothetical protein
MKKEKITTMTSLVTQKDKWEEKGLKLECYSLCSIEAHTIARQDMEVRKNEEKSESTKSDLDDMWYTRDKETKIQAFEDEDWDDNEDFKGDKCKCS